MSKCPDASYCEHHLAAALERLAPIAHVRTEYIMDDSKGQITCKHGPEECAGNLAQLCVERHAPLDKNYDWFYRFLLCTWDSGMPIGSKEGAEECLDKVGAAGAPRAAISRCIAGSEGAAL
ncbi:MAG: hypothetical protein J3K34DRAFT_430520, partial [Monoraphidium minutum]